MNILIDGQTLHTPEIHRGIGTYFKEMIEEILRNDFVNIFYITIDNEEQLSCLSSFSRDKLIKLIDPCFNPKLFLAGGKLAAINHYTNLITDICSQNDIDIYWNPNPQMDNTILPRKSKDIYFTATMYDLIPYVMKDTYFTTWSEDIKTFYLEKMEVLQEYDHLFPISESTKEDIVNLMGILDEKQTVTFCGVSPKFRPYPFPKVVSNEEYILYIGGFDPRKNMFRAIDAFSLFMDKYNIQNIRYKLYLVCLLNEEARDKLISYAKSKNIEKSLVLTGFLEESELLKIYQQAKCFFFPSLYEGFGLPILEALSSGLPIACADNSSLPEVAKEYASYFNAYDIKSMALSLQKILEDSMSLDARLERHRYASEYTWEKPAKIVLEAFLRFKEQEDQQSKKKIAWVSPLPPQRSGISHYSKALLLSMLDKVDIDIYYDSVVPETILISKFKVFPLETLAQRFSAYDEVIYHLGNNLEFHLNIYKYAWDYPSTVVIHDWNIQPFMQESFLGTKDSLYYNKAREIYVEDDGERNSSYIEKFPMSDAIARRSKRVIVHHQWVREQLIYQSNVTVIPLFSNIQKIPSEYDKALFQEKYKVVKKDFLVSMFGDINMNKLPDILIESSKILIDEGYPIKLIFAGKIQDETRYLFNALKSTKYEDKIIATDYLDNEDYFSCLYLSDLIVNLRNPSMGEASLTMAEALYAKKATIIGDSNQYKEFPNEIVAGKVKYNGKEIEQLVKIIKRTLENKSFRKEIEVSAKEYSENILSLDKIQKTYLGQSI